MGEREWVDAADVAELVPAKRPSPLPFVRALPELVDALVVVEAELLFQVHRLEEHVKPDTAEEAVYHADLKLGYEQAAKYVGRLKKYHEGRLNKQRRGREGGPSPYREDDEQASREAAIDAAGRAAAHTNEGE